MNGQFGTFLTVDLSTGRIDTIEIPEEWYSRHVGGYGVAHRLILETLAPGIDPWGEDNVLIFVGGPFQGSGFPGAGRHAVLGKSPKTNLYSDSYAGGYFAHELGRCGHDGILFRGKSAHPVYFLLAEDSAELIDATDLWGLEVRETERRLKERHEGVRVSSIGIAGENRVKSACVINDFSRAAGRPGFGAIMGDKRLKAVALRGSRDRPIADRAILRSLSRGFARAVMEDPGSRWLGEFGSVGSVEALSEMGILPTRNFREGVFDEATAITGARLLESGALVGRETCTGCPVRCKRQVKASWSGTAVDPAYGGLEYESAAALGSLCLVSDLDALCLANQKCNAYGLDTISVGVTVAFAMEASEKGLIPEKLAWGDPGVLLSMIDDLATRKGLGAELAEGIDQVASAWGADFAMHIKGQEIPMHEPRGKVGLALSYATTPRGGSHLEGFHDTALDGLTEPLPELGIEKGKDRFEWDRAATLCKTFEDLQSFTNSLILCANITMAKAAGPHYPYALIRDALGALTGEPMTAEEMLRVGERNVVLRRLLSAREGHRRSDDGIPARLEEPLPRGGSAGHAIPDDELQRRIDEYYELRGYDAIGPTEGRLNALGLGNLAIHRPARKEA